MRWSICIWTVLISGLTIQGSIQKARMLLQYTNQQLNDVVPQMTDCISLFYGDSALLGYRNGEDSLSVRYSHHPCSSSAPSTEYHGANSYIWVKSDGWAGQIPMNHGHQRRTAKQFWVQENAFWTSSYICYYQVTVLWWSRSLRIVAVAESRDEPK